VLAHPLVSRQHAIISLEGDAWDLLDLGSTHGTFVNGEKIERRRLNLGDKIRLGAQGLEIEFLPIANESTSGTVLWTAEAEELEKSIMRLASVLPSDSTGHSELQKMSCLLDFHYYFDKTFSAERIFQQVLKSALEISGAERGYILRREADGFHYALGMDGSGGLLTEASFRASQTTVRRVVADGQPIFMTGGIEADFARQESIVALNLTAIACLPLMAISSDSDEPTIGGILYLDSQRRMHKLSGIDRKILTKLAEEAGNVLEKIGMVETLTERRKLAQELALAEEAQRSLLPQSLPVFESCTMRAHCRPTRHVGGDFYDFMMLDNGDLAGVLADVSGKGVSAALLSSFAQGALNAEFRSTRNLEEAMNRVNKLLCQRTPSSRFVTMFVFVLSPDGRGRFLSAGHNPAYVYRGATGTVEELESGGIPVGAFSFAKWDATDFQLGFGDMLMAYSDGLTEAENARQDMFGEERVREIMAGKGAQGAVAVEQTLLTAVDDFTRGAPQTDDITFFLLQRG
jgi:serine phosphatase RsbU (regulator of sigma subunit)